MKYTNVVQFPDAVTRLKELLANYASPCYCPVCDRLVNPRDRQYHLTYCVPLVPKCPGDPVCMGDCAECCIRGGSL